MVAIANDGRMKSTPSRLYNGPTEPLLQRTESITILDVNEKLEKK